MTATASVPALILRGLRKGFGAGRPAVDGLDLAVPAGVFYALLGPNGAGKTTTLRLVAGLMRPDGGPPGLPLVIPPPAVAEVDHQAPVRPAAALAPAAGTSEADSSRQSIG